MSELDLVGRAGGLRSGELLPRWDIVDRRDVVTFGTGTSRSTWSTW